MTEFKISLESPSEYINQEKSRYPKKLSNPVSINEPLLSLYDGDKKKCKADLDKISSEDHANSLLHGLIPGVPSFFEDLIKEDIVAIGEINSPIPNAKAVRLNGPTYAVLFNSGLSQFLYRVTRAISTRFTIGEQQTEPEAVTFEETCRILTDIFFWYVETGHAFGPSYSINKEQMIVASMLATEAESFFLAHELGHIFNEIAAIVKQESSQAIDSAWGNELAADEFALNVLLSSRSRQDSPIPISVCYAGAELAISIFAGLEAIGVEFDGTHPSAEERLSLLRNTLKSRCEDDATYQQVRAFAEPLDLVFNNIIDKLSHPDWQEFLDHAAAEVISQLDEQLDRCTGGRVPDYVSFHQSMPEIFEKLSSYRLYERVAQAAAEFMGHMKKKQIEGKSAANQESWVALQKYKLFMSSISELNEPARSLLEEALGIET